MSEVAENPTEESLSTLSKRLQDLGGANDGNAFAYSEESLLQR